MKQPIIFVGARNIINDMAIAADAAGHEVLGILDARFHDTVNGIPVIGDEKWLLDPNHAQAQQWLRTCQFIVGSYWDGGQHQGQAHHPGLVRKQHIAVLEQSQAKLATLVHPDAMLDLGHPYSDIQVGGGCFFNRGSLSVASGVVVGNHVVAEAGTIIGDGTVIGNNVILAPGTFLYQCSVGDHVYFGAWSRINIWHKKAPIVIGNDVTVFSGAEIVKDIAAGHMYTGDGRILKKTRI